MKIKETEKIVVKSYETDFGTVCSSKEQCIESETDAYFDIYHRMASREQMLVKKLIDELDKHRYNAYCELGIDDQVVNNLVERIKV